MKILGIDPGTNYLGIAILEVENKNIKYIYSDVLNLTKNKSPYSKLQVILKEVKKIIEKFKPEEMAIEAPFYGRNVQSMLKLGRAQGVAIAAAFDAGIDITEYSPRKVKQAITGNGNASKEQISKMIISVLRPNKIITSFDETDALAVALCHFYQKDKPKTEKKYSDWSDFISKNQDKIK